MLRSATHLVLRQQQRVAGVQALRSNAVQRAFFSSSSAPTVDDVKVGITLIDYAGKSHKMFGIVGQTLVQASELNGLENILTNDGDGAVIDQDIIHNERWTEQNFGEGATSFHAHVLIPDEWLAKLPPVRPDEDSQLDQMDHFGKGPRTPNSRLADQIMLKKELDGMVVHVPDMYPFELE